MIPITWRNRRSGVSKFKIREMGSRYLFIALYCWLEKYFSGGDYIATKKTSDQACRGSHRAAPVMERFRRPCRQRFRMETA